MPTESGLGKEMRKRSDELLALGGEIDAAVKRLLEGLRAAGESGATDSGEKIMLSLHEVGVETIADALTTQEQILVLVRKRNQLLLDGHTRILPSAINQGREADAVALYEKTKKKWDAEADRHEQLRASLTEMLSAKKSGTQ